MSKPDNRLGSVLPLVFTVGLSVGCIFGLGGLWLLIKMAPRLIPGMQNQTASKPATGELTLLGDTFSGYSTFRSAAFQKGLKTVGA